MTVKELIEELNKFEDELVVVACYENDHKHRKICDVTPITGCKNTIGVVS